jgi:predicted metal-dependent enzyme (double-stranded beta helix superfamily)
MNHDHNDDHNVDRIAPLRRFVSALTVLVGRTGDERTLLAEGRQELARLLERDDWLPAAFARPRSDRYAQYLLHADALERFSVVSFVWGPGQRTPVHDHTVWGLVGVLRGAERCDEYRLDRDRPVATGAHHVMQRGDIEAVSPTVGDWHRVSNARSDGDSVSIHVYGANIGAVRRHRLDDSGAMLDFVSGYDKDVLPNLWDRSAAVRSGAC